MMPRRNNRMFRYAVKQLLGIVLNELKRRPALEAVCQHGSSAGVSSLTGPLLPARGGPSFQFWSPPRRRSGGAGGRLA